MIEVTFVLLEMYYITVIEGKHMLCSSPNFELLFTPGQLHYLSQKVVFTHINTSKCMEIHNRGDNLLMTDVMW